MKKDIDILKLMIDEIRSLKQVSSISAIETIYSCILSIEDILINMGNDINILSSKQITFNEKFYDVLKQILKESETL